MNLRTFIAKLEKQGKMQKISKPVSQDLDAAAAVNALGEKPVIFESVSGKKFRVAAGMVSSRELVADALGITPQKLVPALAKAIDAPKKPKIVSSKDAPCQEVVDAKVDLDLLPLLRYFPSDGGRYITSAIAIIKDPDTGPNACYHRMMQIGKDRFTARLVEQRQTYNTYQKLKSQGKELEVAFCIGNSTAVMLAAAISAPTGVDEMAIANALDETPMVRCKTKDLLVPAESEFVLEGRITFEEADEGPFVDLTETNDIVRKQPVVVIDCITHRKDAIYQTLLPGMCEHKNLMGMPREPTILREVSKVCECRDVVLTNGGCSWFHAVVQIKKKNDAEPQKAIAAAFKGHTSLKHCVIVDEDIDICNPQAVEWAIATRFRADSRLYVFKDQPSSSLDPMADKPPKEKARVAKMGLDATIPLSDPKKPVAKFKRLDYKKININKFQ
ncbi:MAG: UbiD family decarboxylase [Candidatus Micrarchaeia archaeon]|jgi:UbiD family decarboxylase